MLNIKIQNKDCIKDCLKKKKKNHKYFITNVVTKSMGI